MIHEPRGFEGVDEVLLVTGLWPYRAVDEKKSLGKLNVLHNPELRERLIHALGVDSIFEIGYAAPEGRRPLFRPITEIEPTLVSVALRALIPKGIDVTEVSIEDVLQPSPETRRRIGAVGASALCLMSTSYITNFHDLDAIIGSLRRMGVRMLVCGGFLATRNPELVIEHGADGVVVGDGEQAIPELIAALHGERRIEEVANLMSRGPDGQPVPAQRTRLFPVDAIDVPIPPGNLASMVIPYESMRGCPYKCAFCSYPLVSTKWRYKSAKKVVDDFREIEKRGATQIVALDSTFTIPYKRLREFLDLYIESGLTIPWAAYSRVTPLKDPEIVERLRQANNRWLSIGFETGSQRMLDTMKKGTRMADAHAALVNLWRARISPWSNFIVGYPGETLETLAETVAFMKRFIFGFYGLYVFNIRDRAMPVLDDPTANVHYDEIGSDWTHATMNSEQASDLRWDAYVDVALTNPKAINIDVFRGSNVEKDYVAWSPSFPALKAIERFAVAEIAPADVRARGESPDALLDQLRMHVEPVKRADDALPVALPAPRVGP